MTEAGITIRYAETDADIIAIHQFLCVVAGPLLPGPIDAKGSIHEVWRVVTDSVGLMAMRDDCIVGTMGLVNPGYWWNGKVKFLANRWLFALEGIGAGKALLKEALAIARASELELHIYDETKGRLKILNKSKNRNVPR